MSPATPPKTDEDDLDAQAEESEETPDAAHESAVHGEDPVSQEPAHDDGPRDEEVLQPTSPNSTVWVKRGLNALFFICALGVAFWAGSWLAPEPPHGANPASGAASGQAAETVWTCSMHPQIESAEPGACPICGMDLIPRAENTAEKPLTRDQLRLSPHAKALAQIQTTRVQPLAAQGVSLELLGRVGLDETRTHSVTPWVGGRVDRLHVETTGEFLKRGQIVASIYSPEVYAAHQDLMQAAKQLQSLRDATPFARSAAQSTLEAARQRLRLLGVPPKEIRRMESAPRPARQIPIRSTFSGTILETLVREGQYVEAGTPLYRLAELDRLWIQLDAYERDLPYIRLGMHVAVSFESVPDRIVDGKVAFVDPVIDPLKRTARVRVEIPNEDGAIRPGMFVRASIQPQNARSKTPTLVVPSSAPLFSGKRSLVYVEVPSTGDPVYEAREVRLGPKMGDVYPIVAGLEYGERVVTHGAFRLDADLQLRGGASLMTRPDDREGARFEGVVVLDDRGREALRPVLEHTLDIHEALAADDLPRAQKHARSLAESVRDARLSPRAAQQVWVRMQGDWGPHIDVLAKTASMQRARVAYEAISVQMDRVLRTFGNVTDSVVRQAYCPMVDGDRGAFWYQRERTLTNAYFGSQMLHCGWIQETIEPGTVATRSPELPPAPEPAEPEPAKAPASSPSSGPASSPASSPSSTPHSH